MVRKTQKQGIKSGNSKLKKVIKSKTKFLPKGLNETKTTFKIKPIVIPNQLKQNEFEDSKDKVQNNIKDILNHLKHYNANIRQRAVEELTNNVKLSMEEIFQNNSSEICSAVGYLMQDQECKVREAAIKCLDTILTYVPSKHLIPFFDYFAINFRCAMSSFNENIQEDSLLFLDCFIKKEHDLLKTCSEKLLPNFLSLISKFHNDSRLGRTLTLNLGKKMTNIAWRIKVLSRLHAIFSITLGLDETMKTNEPEIHIRDASTTSYFAVYKNNQPEKHDVFFTAFVNSEEKETLNTHIQTLIPILHETWLEIMPENGNRTCSGEYTVLDGESAALLTCIMNTLYLLWRYIKAKENTNVNIHSIFQSANGTTFLQHLMKHFPYSQTKDRLKKSNKMTLQILKSNNDPKCLRENFLICLLYSSLHKNVQTKNAEAITKYLTNFFSEVADLDENVKIIVKYLTESFSTTSWDKTNSKVIIEGAIKLFENDVTSEQDKLELLHILLNIHDEILLEQCDYYQQWLITLPNLLCKPKIHSAAVLELLTFLRKCSDKRVLESFEENLTEIIKNLSNLKIIGNTNSLTLNTDAGKRYLKYIFHYLSFHSNSVPKNEQILKYFRHLI